MLNKDDFIEEDCKNAISEILEVGEFRKEYQE